MPIPMANRRLMIKLKQSQRPKDQIAARRAEPICKLPIDKSKGGLRPGVDLDNAVELLDTLDQVTDAPNSDDRARR